MTTVFWNSYCKTDTKWFELTAVEPTPALQEIISERDVSNQGHFARCPAFRDYYKNTYVLKSPVDIEFIYNSENGQLGIFPQKQAFYDENIFHRGSIVGKDDSFLMGFGLDFLFIADKDCELELIPCSMHKSEFADKTRLIVGTFNINKWYRPVEIAFEIKNSATSVKIKRGDALAYVRFLPKDGSKIVLQHKNFSEETLEVVKTCLAVKESVNKFPLAVLYKLSERIRNKLWFNKKKCPFNWGGR